MKFLTPAVHFAAALVAICGIASAAQAAGPPNVLLLTLDTTRRNAHGDPLPKLTWRDADVSRDLRAWSEDQIKALFDTLAKAGNGRVIRTASDSFQDHPGGGCRMGTDASSGVVDSWGRAFEHANLFVVGAPTMVSGSCANATLTFCALSLRSAQEIGREFPQKPA